MYNLSKGVIEKGLAKGRAEGIMESTLSSIRNLMQNMGISVEQAMQLLGIPESDRPKYSGMLSS